MVVISLVSSPPSHPFIFNFPVSDKSYSRSCDMPTFSVFLCPLGIRVEEARCWGGYFQGLPHACPTLISQPHNPTHFWYIYWEDELNCSSPLYLDTFCQTQWMSQLIYFNLCHSHDSLILLISSTWSTQLANTHLLQPPVASKSLSRSVFIFNFPFVLF